MHRIRTILVRTILAVALTACMWPPAPASASAAPRVRLHVTFAPERLGAGTTVTFGFRIATPSRRVPSPLASVALLYPTDLGIATSGLGLANCAAAQLAAHGPRSCPIDSHMGYGSALVEIPFGPGVVRETAGITLLSGPVRDGHLTLFFYANGVSPLSAQIVFPGAILPAPAPFGGRLETLLPVVPSVPEAPDASIVSLRTSLGPLHITYYRRVHGRPVPYSPKGIGLPRRCPRGGFRFSAQLSFQDATHATTHTTVPCPRTR